MDAATRVGYRPNAIARGLITQRSNMVGVVISKLVNLNYPEVLVEITQRLSGRGIRVLLFALETEGDTAAALDQVVQYRVDGVITAAMLTGEQLGMLDEAQIPVVFYNRAPDVPAVNAVRCDPCGGGTLAGRRTGRLGPPAIQHHRRPRGLAGQHRADARGRRGTRAPRRRRHYRGARRLRLWQRSGRIRDDRRGTRLAAGRGDRGQRHDGDRLHRRGPRDVRPRGAGRHVRRGDSTASGLQPTRHIGSPLCPSRWRRCRKPRCRC